MYQNNNIKKLKKLIIYCSVPFFDTWPRKFELKKFKNYGFDIELWSTEEIFITKERIYNAAKGSSEYLYKDLDIIKIKNLRDLDKKLSVLDPEALICIMSLGSLNNNKLINPDLDLFNQHKIKYIIFHLCPHLVVPNIWFKFRLNLRLIQKRLMNYKKKPTLVIGTGTEGRKQVNKLFNKNIIYKSVPSYNILWTKEEPEIKDKYIVYVEEAVGSSPDVALLGFDKPVVDAEGFYKRINNLFEKIEKWTNLKVVVAASGKYNYKVNPFQNRQIIYKKTSNLIQHSEFVFGHSSLALDQSIVENKPLFILNDKGFSNLKNKTINNLALAYELKPIWTDMLTKSDFIKKKSVDEYSYKKIIKKYLKEENIKGSFLENISKAFNEI